MSSSVELFKFFRLWLAGTAVLCTGCSTTSVINRGTASQDNAASLFALGTLSPPGSPDRVKAGQILEDTVNKVYTPTSFSKNSETKKDQLLAKRIFQLTANYLKSSNLCRSEEKIRVYRGIGEQPVLRRTGSKMGAAYFGGLQNAIVEGLVKASLLSKSRIPLNELQDSGELAFENFNAISADINWDQLPVFIKNEQTQVFSRQLVDWKMIFGFGRKALDGKNVDGKWSDIAKTHSLTAPETPLISVSLDAESAMMFGPSLLVLDVCPERLMPSVIDRERSRVNFYETEFYLPITILPEEVVNIEGIECRNQLRKNNNGSELCKKGAFKIQSETKRTENADKFWKLFYNFNHSFERMYVHIATQFGGSPELYLSWPASLSGERIQKFYAQLTNSSGTIEDWRSQITSMSIKPDCDNAAGVIDGIESLFWDIKKQENDPEAKAALEIFEANYIEYKHFLEKQGCKLLIEN